MLGKKTLEELQPILKSLDASLGDFRKLAKDFDATLADINKITGPFGSRSDRISTNLDKITTDLAALMESLDRSNGTLKKILTDPSLYNNIDAAAVNAAKLIPYLERILKDFRSSRTSWRGTRSCSACAGRSRRAAA